MFRKNDNNNKKTYQSFDSWLESAQKSINDFKEEIEKELEEEEKKQTYESGKKPTVYRRFSDNKDVKEKFPRPSNKKYKNISQLDNRDHEGKTNSRGSISGTGVMGSEGYSSGSTSGVNPELRKRLREKKKREAEEARKLKKKTRRENKRQRVILAQQKSLKKKQNLRKAILAAEILGPPKAKKFS